MADKYGDLTLDAAVQLGSDDPATRDLLAELQERVTQVRPEQDRFREWADRADHLYYPELFTEGGADLWPDDPNRGVPGRAHVSVNTPATYVDVPAALQAVPPVENMLAKDTTKESRAAAAAWERLYTAWKTDQEYDLKFHKACTVKGLYGRTASRLYWDKDAGEGGKACIEIIEQPRNLFIGYKSDRYELVEWAAFVQRMDPNALIEEFGVDVGLADVNGSAVPYVSFTGMQTTPATRSWLNYGPSRVEVWDYWYRKPASRPVRGKPTKMETWNVIIAGNAIVRGPSKYTEYKGAIPYNPLFNTFLPGSPDGRADLYDIEPLLREKYERITSGSQMIGAGTSGDFWQLTGPEAPKSGNLKPARNQVVYPGPGNRIETITPFIAQFQLEQYLTRLDREAAVVSGLNDLLLGLAPAQVLSSSKALNALIANYETRLAMRRLLLYAWRRRNWEMASTIMAAKNKLVAKILKAGGGILDIEDPSLSPRDEFETAQRAASLVNAKLWAQRRGMDAVHVDDPETEQEMIREERTDATLFPADVQVMAQLMSALQALGLQPPAGATQQAQGQLARGQNDLATALGAATPPNTTSTQGEAGMGQVPPEAMQPGATPPNGQPFAQAPQTPQPGGPGPVGVAQTMIQGGQAKSRILTQQTLGRR